MKEQLKKYEDLLLTEQVKNKLYEDTNRAIKGGDKDSIQARIVDLTKQNAINEVNIMKMSRKY